MLSLIAPRNLYIASASEDKWADPISEFLCGMATNSVYQLWNKQGLISSQKIPKEGEMLHEGCVGYHLRKGTHDLTRYDWNRFIQYINCHKKDDSL